MTGIKLAFGALLLLAAGAAIGAGVVLATDSNDPHAPTSLFITRATGVIDHLNELNDGLIELEQQLSIFADSGYEPGDVDELEADYAVLKVTMEQALEDAKPLVWKDYYGPGSMCAIEGSYATELSTTIDRIEERIEDADRHIRVIERSRASTASH